MELSTRAIYPSENNDIQKQSNFLQRSYAGFRGYLDHVKGGALTVNL